MSERDLLIEGQPDDLLQLKELLYGEIPNIELIESAETEQGRHGEPILIALAVALGGPLITREVMKTIRRWLDVRLADKKVDLIKFSIQHGGKTTPVDLNDLSLVETGDQARSKPQS